MGRHYAQEVLSSLLAAGPSRWPLYERVFRPKLRQTNDSNYMETTMSTGFEVTNKCLVEYSGNEIVL